MQSGNPFDRAISVRFSPAEMRASQYIIGKATAGKSAEDVRDCAIYLADTLDLCWDAARSVFESKARPEHALAIYDRLAGLIAATDGNYDRILAAEYYANQSEHGAPSAELTLEERARLHASVSRVTRAETAP